jgi:hypothetical protein
MLTYALVGFVFFALGIAATRHDEIKRAFKRKKATAKYQRLLNGTPKRVVHLRDWGDLWTHRKYPVYINGQVFAIASFGFWHCNDESKRLLDRQGNDAGYLINQITGSKRKSRDRWHHYRAIALAKRPSLFGEVISISAVVEVY